ncbi:MAG TPA: Rv1535 family protein [Mycobacterium sp.]|nr:Rv1535 family protein [Mycobacterium sp.]HTX95675.1 Rv1535 family protein [Mycobacterium sp.]
MTAVLYDEVVTVAPTRTLTVVRDTDTIPARAAKKAAPRVDTPPFGIGGDPLVDGAARLLTVGVRHVYAALWRVGVLDVRA